MLKHAVLLAVSFTGVTAPYAAEKAVVPVTMTQSVAAPAAGPVDPVRRAWIERTMSRVLDDTEVGTDGPPHAVR